MPGELSYSVLISRAISMGEAERMANRELGIALMEELRKSSTPMIVELREEIDGNYLPYPQLEVRTYLEFRPVQYKYSPIYIPDYKRTVVESWLLKFWNWLRGKKHVT